MERGGTASGFSAHSPDILGCIAAGATIDEVRLAIKEAIEFHLEGFKIEGLAIPQPTVQSDYVTVAA